MPLAVERLRDLTEEQWGLFTRRQAVDAGVGWSSMADLVRRGLIERVAHGVYRMRGAPEPDNLGLRAAWLQLDPARSAWERVADPEDALVSHTSAAALYGMGDLRADIHEFTVAVRRQTGRSDVRLHRGRVPPEQRQILHGLPATRAARMIGDLLADNVGPDSVARITAETVERVFDYPANIAESVAPYASRFGFRKGDGLALFDHLLALAGYRDRVEVVALVREG